MGKGSGSCDDRAALHIHDSNEEREIILTRTGGEYQLKDSAITVFKDWESGQWCISMGDLLCRKRDDSLLPLQYEEFGFLIQRQQG